MKKNASSVEYYSACGCTHLRGAGCFPTSEYYCRTGRLFCYERSVNSILTGNGVLGFFHDNNPSLHYFIAPQKGSRVRLRRARIFWGY
ncbi:MAG: hypothetical protein E3K32_03425 [wastewater metagenome]|nr:hypothetical protein [Candidatus Loosdrechtia aerotolerans]